MQRVHSKLGIVSRGRRFSYSQVASVSLDYLVGLVGAVPVAADEKDAASAWIFLSVEASASKIAYLPCTSCEGRL